MKQPANLKPFVWRKREGSKDTLCRICLSELEDGISALYWGANSDGRKDWVHYACWQREAKANREEIEQHDRTATNQPVAATQTDSKGGMPLATGEWPAGQGADELRDELQQAFAQAYDIEAHVGSLLASLRVLASKVSK